MNRSNRREAAAFHRHPRVPVDRRRCSQKQRQDDPPLFLRNAEIPELPPGFTDKVMARLHTTPPRRPPVFPVLGSLLAAELLAAAGIGGNALLLARGAAGIVWHDAVVPTVTLTTELGAAVGGLLSDLAHTVASILAAAALPAGPSLAIAAAAMLAVAALRLQSTPRTRDNTTP